MNAINHKHLVLYALSLLAVGYACFYHVIGHPLDLDDHEYIQDSIAISQDFSSFFSPDKHFGGRPLTEGVLWIGYVLFGADASGLHGFSLLFHYMASLLIAYTCLRMNMGEHVSFLTGLLFLVNIAHFHAVFWIAAVAYPLSMCFSALAIISYLNYEKKPKQWSLVGIYAFSTLGVLGHVGAAFVWPFCLSLAWFSGQHHRIMPLILLGPLLGIVVISLAMAYPNVAQVDQAAHIPQSVEIVHNLLWYWSRLFSTAHWLFTPLYQLATWELYLGGFVVVFLVVAVWYGQWRPVSWIILSTLPFVTMPTSFLASIPSGPSRYLYFPSAGASMLLAWIICRTAAALRQPTHRCIALALCAFVLTGWSAYQLRVVETSSFYNAGRNYSVLGRVEESAHWLQRATAGNPLVVPLVDTYSRLSAILPYIGKSPQESIRQGLELAPQDIYLRLASAINLLESMDYQQRRDGEKLLQDVKHSFKINGQGPLFRSNAAAIYHNLGVGYMLKEHHQRAILAFSRALEYQPDKTNSQVRLSQAYSSLGFELQLEEHFEEAQSAYTQAIEVNPQNTEAHFNIGALHYIRGRYRHAIESYKKALEIGGESYILFNIGIALLANGDIDSAKQTYARAISELGDEEGLSLGAPDDLSNFIINQPNQHLAEAAEHIMETYWPTFSAD